MLAAVRHRNQIRTSRDSWWHRRRLWLPEHQLPLSWDTMSGSSLSSVVSHLVRAQMGTSLAPTVTDEDLDRHVAELILKEAKQKAEKYGQDGIRAYLQSNL